ncbi:hypothetical protein [Kineococcus sp. SYSU DK003]|uniref:hypothetical protein n=1 Tax=Kineococcus sp. SYSU DK003 TaxID=3383124 RepID=UPI003D7E9B3C
MDVPAELSARARVFSSTSWLHGQGRETGAAEAHSTAVVTLRLLADRRDELGVRRTETVNRVHQLLPELVPGGAKTFLSAARAGALVATVRPRDVAGRTRRADPGRGQGTR